MKKGQTGTEYLIIMGFVTFLIVSIIGIASFFIGGINDRIKMDQVQNYANKIITSAESVYYSGNPSKVTINTYLPTGVRDISIIEDSLVMNISTSSGLNSLAFHSNVPISGSLSSSDGVKRITVIAELNGIVLSE